MKKIKIGKNFISDKHKSFIIAEIGVNHNGKISIAKKLINKAIACGADCVKFQTFRAKNIATKKTPLAKYQIKNKAWGKNQYDMLKRLQLSKGDFKILFNYCKKKKIEFLSTPNNYEDVDFLNNLGVNAFKLASMHAVEPEFIKYIALKKKPMIVSSGMCNFSEVKEMIKIIKNNGNNKICLLQCTSDYPANIEDSNINVLNTYKKKFKTIIGYSDHTKGFISAIASVALGAKVFEKHFTLNNNMKGPDHKASLNPKNFKIYVKNIRLAEKSLGSNKKFYLQSEKNTRLVARRSLAAKEKLFKGEKIKKNKIKFMRPSNGIKVKYLNFVINKKLKKNLYKKRIS